LSAAEQNASAKEATSQILDKKAPAFPALTGRVVDQARVLSQSTKDELETLLATHENNTTNQVVVVTIESLGNAQIEEYSIELARHWGIGQKGKDNGVVLVVAPNDKQVRIEVGYGLEGTLTDALSSSIINYYIIPEFKKGDIQNGINIGIQKIIALLDGDEGVREEIEAKSDYEMPIAVYGIIGGIAMIFASAFLGDMVMNIGLSVMVASIIGLFVNWIFGLDGIAGISVVFGIAALLFYLVKDVKVGSGGGSSSRDSSSGSSSSGGGGSSGGGFSGGGGSFGGGGASGRW